MKRCPECGASVSDEARFCTKCGAKLPEQVAPAAEVPEPAEPVAAATAEPVEYEPVAADAPLQKEASITCPSCGHANPAHAPYCEACGAPLSAELSEMFTGSQSQPEVVTSQPQDGESTATVGSERPRPVESNATQAADAPAPTPQAAASQTAGSKPVQQQGQPVSQQSQSGQQQNQTVYNQPTGQNAGDGSGEEKAEHTKAVLSLVLGIIGVVIYWPSYLLFDALFDISALNIFGGAIIGIVLGIVGLVLASEAKKAGNREGIRTAGFVLSLIALILNIVYIASCVACAATMNAYYAAVFSGEI